MKVEELGRLLRSGRASCVELVRDALAKAAEHSDLNAFITVTEDQALAEAAERDRELAAGRDRGPLHGVPIGTKDLFYTRGVRTTGGSLLFKQHVPEHDAEAVSRLREAGAISIGKTNLHELAFGITSLNPHYRHVLNPLDKARLAGGSSGGTAAAIAAGITPIGLGTDTGGSIRIPASYCGIVGLKPTYGRVSRRGVLPLAFSLDHVGPMGLCAADCALALNAIAGHDANDPTSAREPASDFNLPALPDLAGVRVGRPKNFFFDTLDAEVLHAVDRAIDQLRSSRAEISEVQFPDFAEINLTSHMVILSEFAAQHQHRRDQTEFGKDVWALLELGRQVAAHEYINAQRLRTLFRREMDRLWEQIDVLVTPTTPVTAPLAGEETLSIAGKEENVRMASTRLLRGFNLLGEPALSMPCGMSRNGMPVGLQLISKPFDEARLLQVAKTLEERLDVSTLERHA